MTTAHGGIDHEGRHYSTSDDTAWYQFVCGFCGIDTSGAVIARMSDGGRVTKWIRCTACGKGSVLNTHFSTERIDPPKLGGDSVEHLPVVVDKAYKEARDCFSIGAYTACALLCRKILMHVAVEKGDGEGKRFTEYLDYLEDQGYVTPPLKNWVDHIRQNGNVATHELPAVDSASAENSLTFTAQMLRIIYEMPGKAGQLAQDEVPPGL